jgi:hypothetical protein
MKTIKEGSQIEKSTNNKPSTEWWFFSPFRKSHTSNKVESKFKNKFHKIVLSFLLLVLIVSSMLSNCPTAEDFNQFSERIVDEAIGENTSTLIGEWVAKFSSDLSLETSTEYYFIYTRNTMKIGGKGRIYYGFFGHFILTGTIEE